MRKRLRGLLRSVTRGVPSCAKSYVPCSFLYVGAPDAGIFLREVLTLAAATVASFANHCFESLDPLATI